MEALPSQMQQLRQEVERLRGQMDALRARLDEPEEIVRAIRDGEVDAFVVHDPQGERIYSLRNADVLYRAMVENMREGAVALDDDGLIVYTNAFFADLVNHDRAALVGTSIFAFVPPDARPFFENISSGVQTSRADLVLRAADGVSVPVHATMNRIALEGTAIHCLIVTDLTPERRRQQLLAESRRKDEFLAMLAHELRNPIAPIRNAVEVLQLTGTLEPRVRWAKDMIDRQVGQLSRLVDDLLDISRITRGKIRLQRGPVELSTVISRAVETARPDIDGRHHQLRLELPAVPLRVMGDQTRLSQVVSNMLHNAAKFTPEGGHIVVRLEQADEEARIAVEDDGVGIAPEMFGSIFDVFTQADATVERSQGGLGIGLALVRSVVEMHGGRVSVHSDGPGRGSQFVVTLPLLAAGLAEETAATAPRAQAAPGPPARRVLVVDDNVDSAESLMLLLREMGHDVRMVTQGRQVLDEARDFHPHAILLDIGLPDISGYEVAAELRRTPELSRVCLVALTGYGQAEHRRRSRESGFDHHWVKPLDVLRLQELLGSTFTSPS